VDVRSVLHQIPGALLRLRDFRANRDAVRKRRLGPDNIDRVFAHETGHVFGALDEYKDSKCSCGGAHGRFGDPNDNCESCGPGEICLMKKNDFTMCRHTYRHLGWVSPVRTVKTVWVTSISVRPDRLDAFVVDGDGRVRNAFWQPDMPEWFQGWVDVLGGRAKPGAPVTAVSRSEGYLDVFVIGTDRQVWTAARDAAGRWDGWWPIPPRIGGHGPPAGRRITRTTPGAVGGQSDPEPLSRRIQHAGSGPPRAA